MKKFYFILIALFSFSFVFAAPVNNVLTDNGDWSSSSTWSLGRIPVSGDTVYVPVGITLKVASDIFVNNVYVKVDGTLSLGNAILDLGTNSTVILLANATVVGGHPQSKLQINGVVKLSGRTTQTGPAYANSTSGNGFTSGFTTLPVQFAGFSAQASSTGNLLQWATAQELNAKAFEVEYSVNGNTWATIAVVKAKGTSTSLTNYSYTDKNSSAGVAYYRIKEIDLDGAFQYTAVSSVRNEAGNNNSVTISSSLNHRVMVRFSAAQKGNVVVRFISLSGQVMSQQELSLPAGVISLNSSNLKGNYIVSVSNSQNLHIAQQVIL